MLPESVPTEVDSSRASPSRLPISLELRDLCARYGSRVVFQHLTLTLHAGEVLVVCGANGSGKSTLLRVLCGLQWPASGWVRYHWQGHPYAPREATQLVGWLSPDMALYRELTGRENLQFFSDVRGLRRPDDYLNQLLAMVGLSGRGDERVAGYSSGMVHRLRYAYALLHEPPVLLLDEPTVTLDERGTEMVSRVIARQRQRGIVVIATNDPREQPLGDYVLTLG